MEKPLMMPLIALLMGFSLLGMSSCSTTVPRPDTPICVTNVPALHEKCYNLKTDYDDNGILLPGAKAFFLPCPEGQVCRDPATHYVDEAAMLAGLNKKVSTTPDGFAQLKTYIRNIRDEQGRKGN